MVKRLVFKGDQPVKKRKRKEGDDHRRRRHHHHREDDDHDHLTRPRKEQNNDDGDENNNNNDDDNDDDDDRWVTAEATTDITGPVIFALPSEEATCLTCDANGKVFAGRLENIVGKDLTTAEPHDVRQVWVANRVAGVEGISFKGHHGRYLGCDRFGLLSADREAISAEETFRCIPCPDTPGTFSIQTERDTFLTISDPSTVQVELRGDADSISFNTTVRIRMQARFKPRLKANKAERAREKISRRQLEETVGHRLDEDEVKRLKRARRQGNYHEAILDVRVKGKHDKFASC